MSEIKFYSEYDMTCGLELRKIIEKVKNNTIESEWVIADVLDFHNILKYISIDRFMEFLIKEIGVDIKLLDKKIKQRMGIFIGEYREVYLDLYDEIDFTDVDDFFEIFENFKIYEGIEVNDFRQLLAKENVHIYTVLKFKRLTEYFDKAVKDELLSNSRNAEIILSKFLKEDDGFLPQSLTEIEILCLIDEYIDSPLVNINVLRKIITFPTNKGLSISDKIKLHAKKKAKEEEERIFSHGTWIESGVSISYDNDQQEAILVHMKGAAADIKISRNWIEENLDYPTLWNNFIYVFNFVDYTMRLVIDSKKSEVGVFESIIQAKGDHLYNTSSSFGFKEMLSDSEIYTYSAVLNVLGIRIEEMIEWFFIEYLKEEFQINNFIVKMPSPEASYLQKCRTILPEIDRILKQYNVLIEDGVIDQDLIQMSSSSVKNKDIKSFNEKKYVYPLSNWYRTASFLLFSEQSHIFYLPTKAEKYSNFYNLLISEKLIRTDFEDYQLRDMQWLFDNNIIHESESGYFEFVDKIIVFILRELYYQEVLSYWRYPENVKKTIEEMANRGIVAFENSLFSRNELDYLDYYLNKSKFTNGLDIRNKYLHGTNTNDEKQYQIDYYKILKLIVIIILKINDDLCIKEDFVNNPH